MINLQPHGVKAGAAVYDKQMTCGRPSGRAHHRGVLTLSTESMAAGAGPGVRQRGCNAAAAGVACPPDNGLGDGQAHVTTVRTLVHPASPN